MKKIFEYIILLFLFVFSLIYTDKMVNIIKSNDPIMKEIIKESDSYKTQSINATIVNNVVIPGLNGCEIDINSSYMNMKKIDNYNYMLLKYKDILPIISINNIYDKYIVEGNIYKRNVSLVININNDIQNLSEINNIKLNLFINSKLLENGKIDINKDFKIYNGGIYNETTIEWVNNLINKNYNKSNYCLLLEEDNDSLKICKDKKMHTILPKLIVTNNNTNKIKSEISNGSIIYFDENNIDQIYNIYNYVIKKGFKVVYLDELLSEDNC